MAKVTETVQEQILKAMDGRTQRWVALNSKIPESDFSKKLKGKQKFTQEEIDAINDVLKVKIKLSA